VQNIPCSACLEQVKANRLSKPHPALEFVGQKPFRGSTFGGWEEKAYQCRICGSAIEHTNDKNEFAPFWWFTRSFS
jgi:hypothetical protein